MGWKEKGKYGVSTGRTVRSPFAEAHGFSCTIPGRETETLLKFTRGTEKFSDNEMVEFLAENEIGDGLGNFAESSRVPWSHADSVHRSSVPYSLKKRKRWRLSELAEENSVELNDSEEGPNVTFVHRRVPKKPNADCIAIQKTKQHEVFTPRKRRYTRVQDLLKKCDQNEMEPEVGYEISYRYPSNEYPECGEGHGPRYRWSFQWSLRNPGKARSKNKGIKNKSDRWGMYSDGEVKSGKIRRNQLCHVCEVDDGSLKYLESKVEVIDAESFSEWKAADKSYFAGGASFDLGSYLEELTKHPRRVSKETQPRTKSERCIEDQSQKGDFVYGKKSVVFIDSEPCANMVYDQDASNLPLSAAEPQILQAEKKEAVTLLLNGDDIQPENLKAQWNDLYTEGNSVPRKFTIDVIPLLSAGDTATSEFCCVLFEVTNKTDNGSCSTATNVSLHVGETGSIASNLICKAVTKFSRAKQDIWRLRDIMDYAVHCLRDCYQPLQHVTCTPNSPKTAKRWRSVEVLSSMFGWKSEVCTRTEIKSELRLKLKEQNRNDQLDDALNTVESLDKFCGICYEELGNQILSPFTALKHCGHVFCNECWEIHLKTQISLGYTDLQCPGYKCDTHVDDVTILALVPSLYDKYLSQKLDKALEASPEVRWCPSTTCSRVFRVSASGAVANGNSPMAVACACGGLWCFQCGRQAHWPASCSGDTKFQEITKHFFAELEENKEDLITSVMVRNCPHCHYPIEKNMGCNFMYCIMCQTAFCWECLQPMSKHKGTCQRHEKDKEVELDYDSSGTNHFAKYFSMYCNNKKARSGKVMSDLRHKLRTVDKSVTCYKSFSCSCAYFNEIMEGMLQSGCPDVLRSATEFKYYAHLTLEGTAKMAIASKSDSKGLKQHLERLQFIVDIVEELAKCDIRKLSDQNHLNKLAAFVNYGKNCVFTIGQILASGWH